MGNNWRKKVLKRDLHTCQKCDLNKDQTMIEAHHIIKTGSSKPEHGISLCLWCHKGAPMGYKEIKDWLNDDKDIYDELMEFLGLFGNGRQREVLNKVCNQLTKDDIKYLSSAMSVFLNNKRKQQLLRGVESAEKRGSPTNGIPWGFKAKDGKLVPEPSEMNLVKRILAMKNSGMGPKSIADTLNDEGVKTKGGKLWTRQNINWVIYRYNKRRINDQNDRHKKNTGGLASKVDK